MMASFNIVKCTSTNPYDLSGTRVLLNLHKATFTADGRAINMVETMNDIGVSTIIYTDISTDGMLKGPNLEAQEEMLKISNARIIASGGVSGYEDVANLAALAQRYPNLDGVIIGMALYEGRVELADLTRDFPD